MNPGLNGLPKLNVGAIVESQKVRKWIDYTTLSPV